MTAASLCLYMKKSCKGVDRQTSGPDGAAVSWLQIFINTGSKADLHSLLKEVVQHMQFPVDIANMNY